MTTTLGDIVTIAFEEARAMTAVPELAAELATYLVFRTIARSPDNAEVARQIVSTDQPSGS